MIFMQEALRQMREAEEALRRADHAARSTPKAKARIREQYAEFERLCRETLGPRPHANSGPFSVSEGRY